MLSIVSNKVCDSAAIVIALILEAEKHLRNVCEILPDYTTRPRTQ